MRVGVAAYLLYAGADYRSAGVSTYTRQLLLHLPGVAPQHEVIALHGANVPGLPGIQSLVSPVPTDRPLVRIAWEQLALPLVARRQRFDVLHGTVNVLPLLASAPGVITVHDLSFLRLPERLAGARVRYLKAAVAASVRKAQGVIAVSYHTSQELMELLAVPPERIQVVPSGVDARFQPMPAETVADFRREHFQGRPFILHVGTLEPRKNLDVLLRAFAAARAAGDLPHVLALVGGRGWMYQPLFALVAGLGLQQHVAFLDFVPAEELPLWYNSSDLFAYPSAYEGFGLPVLEAMACGAPVITTAGSALGELVGSAGMTVQPGSSEALEAAITRVLEDATLRDEMSRLGRMRAAEFSWERTARETVAVYEQVAKG